MKAYTQEEHDIAADVRLSNNEVVTRTGRSYPSVVRYRKSHGIDAPDTRGKRWSDEEDDKLQEYHRAGDRRKEIARDLDRSEASIAARLAILKKQGRI